MPATRELEPIHPDCLYPLATLDRFGLRQAAIRGLRRRRDLKILRAGRRGFVRGADLIAAISRDDRGQ